MTIGKGKRPRDTNQLAKFIVDVTTGEVNIPDPDAGKNPSATHVALSKNLMGMTVNCNFRVSNG